MSDNSTTSKTKMQNAFLISGAVTMVSLAFGYLIYSKYYREKSSDHLSDSSGEDFILDKSLKKASRSNVKG